LDLERLTRQRDTLDKQIHRLNQTIAGLSALVSPNGDSRAKPAGQEAGLTKTVLAAFSLSEAALTAPELRAKVIELGYTWKNPQNALNSVHVTLRRLLEKKEIRAVTSGNGTTTAYELNEVEAEPPF
jgi:hypothetical protein